ncbi:hypothetical protein OXYTRIMIC_291 [Oxytricha trifallax]|uniref:Uncharacterized protein n=1 Tax=Oxytricha trifallax TaxID=1172189 RepID=A0A073HY86_9SPIT|nr:hypothetical protein OXYTRIMIC_291 [Oxytricha trifallax]
MIQKILDTNEIRIASLGQLQKDIQEKILNRKFMTVEYIRKHYQSLGEQTILYYLPKFQQYQLKLRRLNNILEQSISETPCAQCGCRAQLISLRKEDYYRELESIMGRTRTQQNMHEFEDKIKQKVDQEGTTVYKVCYYCWKNELKNTIPENTMPQPEQLKKLKSKAEQALIRLGYIYSFIQNTATSGYQMMKGDTNFKLFNTDVGMHKLALQYDWMQHITAAQKGKVDEALKLLKDINHLYQRGVCTYELWQRLSTNEKLKDFIESDQFKCRIARGYNQDQFYIQVKDLKDINKEEHKDDQGEWYVVPSSNSEHGHDLFNVKDLRRLAAFEEYVESENYEDILKDIQEKFKDDSKDNQKEVKKNLVYYADKFLEEKLFPTLFPTGWGGYNSSYYNETIKLQS